MNISDLPEYKIWVSMRQRCNNPNERAYKHYGGRGIKVSEEWNDFDVFQRDMGERPKGTSIDRIDNDGNYCKENCKWSTKAQQSRNRRNNVQITYKGKTQVLKDWATEFGMTRQSLDLRLAKGMTMKECDEIPKRHFRTLYKGESATQASNRLGGRRETVTARLQSGWSLKEAFTIPIRGYTKHEKS